MTARRIIVVVLALASLTIGMYAQGGGGRGGGRGAGGAEAPPQPGNLITGAWGEQALKPDARGWGWMVKQYVANAQRPLWNQAKEKLLNDGKVTSVTISSLNPEQYCEARKHWDYIWFEMQHSTMSFADVQKMLAACPGPGGGAPMIRMPDALEANIQRSARLERWIVVLGVDREGEHTLVALKERGCTAAMVRVAVNDGSALDAAVALQQAYRQGDIIEETEALAVIVERVVKAAADVAGDAA